MTISKTFVNIAIAFHKLSSRYWRKDIQLGKIWGQICFKVYIQAWLIIFITITKIQQCFPKTKTYISMIKQWYNMFLLFFHQQLIVLNALYGIFIGIGLACPILIVATGNIITGLLALFCLCCSTVCVVGVIPLGGWQLGVSYI